MARHPVTLLATCGVKTQKANINFPYPCVWRDGAWYRVGHRLAHQCTCHEAWVKVQARLTCPPTNIPGPEQNAALPNEICLFRFAG
jgi:hypothetical protein